jgi:hypothetical protein
MLKKPKEQKQNTNIADNTRKCTKFRMIEVTQFFESLG